MNSVIYLIGMQATVQQQVISHCVWNQSCFFVTLHLLFSYCCK